MPIHYATAGAVALVLLAASLPGAAANAAVREVYTCSYINDATRDDLMAARDFLVEQYDALDIEDSVSFMWTPLIVQDFDADFLWFNVFEDLNAFATVGDAYWSSDEGVAADARFAEIVECSSSLANVDLVYDGGPLEELEGPAVVASFACQLNEGQDGEALQALVSEYTDLLGDVGDHDQHLFYQATPYVGSSPMDAYFFGVHDSLSTWAERQSALQDSDTGQAFFEHADEVMSCTNALWWGEAVITADE